MSCISSNFSSFFLNSLNDPSEFAKYLSNGELKFSSFEDFQAFGASAGSGAQQQAPQQQQQQQYLVSGINNNNNANLSGITAGGQSGAAEVFNGSVGVAAGAGVQHMDTSSTYTHPTLATAGVAAVQQQHHPQQQQQQQQQQHLSNHPAHPHPTQHPAPLHNYTHSSSGVTNFQHNASPRHPPNLPLPPNANPAASHPQAFPTQRWPTAAAATPSAASQHHTQQHHPHQQHPQHSQHPTAALHGPGTPANSHQQQQQQTPTGAAAAAAAAAAGAQHFDGSFEFLKYLRHSNDFSSESSNGDTTSSTSSTSQPTSFQQQQQHQLQHQQHQQQQHQQQQQQSSTSSSSSLIDLDSSTTHKSRSSRKVAALLSSVSRLTSANSLDVFDHDSKHTIFDLHHMSGSGATTTNSSNSTESSSLELSNFAFPNSHLNASNSNTSSEGAAAGSSDFSMLNSSSASTNAPKPLASFAIKDNFDVHPSHKVEEGIFQHMNKLPPKKKENLKQLGVRFTGQMTLTDKSIVVENFVKFCQEYDIKDHRPFLSLNQSGLNKPDQIKFARYLGQGLPTFTLFCIYSNFKNLFCTKRTEIYTKDGYNLPYILDKTKRFLSNTTADLKNMVQQQSNDGAEFSASNNNNSTTVSSGGLGANSTGPNSAEPMAKCIIIPKVLENLVIFENFDVHETHRVEDGVCTHITRLPPKKQDMFKQFGIQSNQTVTYYEKYIVIENFIKFCNEYKITDHRPFLDFHENGLPKCEQVKFVRYLGQGLPNLTLNKIYLAFKDILGLNRIEKITLDGYNLDTILKKKKKNLYNRMHAAVPI